MLYDAPHNITTGAFMQSDNEAIKQVFGKGDARMNASLLHMLHDSIMETQVNGHEIIYFSGKFIGERVANSHMSKYTGSNIIDMLKHALRRLNIGTVSGIRIRKDTITLDIDNCALYKKNNRDCHFLLGLIAGMASQLSGKKYIGKSMKCRNNKKNTCVFVVKRK